MWLSGRGFVDVIDWAWWMIEMDEYVQVVTISSPPIVLRPTPATVRLDLVKCT
jgi:hypothetical protein